MLETWRADAEGRIPAPGDVLAGKFVIEDVLGSGAMGVVLSALHKQLGERVAIKILVSAHTDSIDRFDREMRIIARLRGEHVVRVLDAGRTDAGVPFLVMEHLRGEALSELLRREGQLTGARAADFALQMCEGLAEAHGAGIVHRDVKPSNLFVVTRPDGSPLVKLIDFGIAKAGVLDADAELTRTHSLLGSPSYASPEQITAPRSVDARSDVWACGVTLFRMVTGRLPFEGETLAHVCMNVVGEPAPAARALNGEISAALEAVIARCLEKDASRRFATVAALAEALEPCASSRAQGTAARVGDILARAAIEGPGETGEVSGPRLSRMSPLPGDVEATTQQTAETADVERTRTGALTSGSLAALPAGARARSGATRLRWGAPIAALAVATGIVVFTARRETPAAIGTGATGATGAAEGAATMDPSASALPPGAPLADAASTAAVVSSQDALPAPPTPHRAAGPPRVRAHAAPRSTATGATLVCPGDPRCTR